MGGPRLALLALVALAHHSWGLTNRRSPELMKLQGLHIMWAAKQVANAPSVQADAAWQANRTKAAAEMPFAKSDYQKIDHELFGKCA